MILKVVLSNSTSLAACEKAIAKENDYSADQERLQRAVRGLAHRQRWPGEPRRQRHAETQRPHQIRQLIGPSSSEGPPPPRCAVPLLRVTLSRGIFDARRLVTQCLALP
jgi:hypothetical protein